MPPEGGKEQLDSAKNTFFANRGEKVVFWASVFGLLLVALLSGFRYLRSEESSTMTIKINRLQVDVDSLLAQQHVYKSLADSLQNEITFQQERIGSLEKMLAERGETP